jgi:hypothetical protein
MKNYLSLLLLAFSVTAFSSDVMDEYSKILIGRLPKAETVRSTHTGIIISWNDPVKLGLYGAKLNNNKFDEEEYTYKLIGEVEVSLNSVGVTLNMINADHDTNFTINNLDGLQLDEVCGNFYGLKSGLALGIGGTGFTAINNSGVILRSSVSVLGWVKIDLSGVRTRVRCLDPKNPNWKKTVRF